MQTHASFKLPETACGDIPILKEEMSHSHRTMIAPHTAENALAPGFRRLPDWFKVKLSTNERYTTVRGRIREGKLNTVCESAACPNRNECWNAGTATFLVLGTLCTRGCRFCNVPQGQPSGIDGDEPGRVAAAVEQLQLTYAVVTSVTRDDLPDGGAGIFAETIRSIRRTSPGCRVEVLVPDFQGSETALETVLAANPDVLNHNLETVPSLYLRVRPRADYRRSLHLLEQANRHGAVTKTGLMLGLGEGKDELRKVLRDLCNVGCDILTMGQYLQPTPAHLPVERYYDPGEFAALQIEATNSGIRTVVAGPLVRSSYRAERQGGFLKDNSTDNGDRDRS
jgi:lipoic acid synthetase